MLANLQSLKAVVVCGCAFTLTGCGYSSARPFRDSVQSVHVEIFQNRDFRQDLEFRLSEAVAKRIEIDTPYKLASKKNADTVLSGEIVQVRQNILGNDFRTDQPRETGTTFIISYRWQDLRNGRVLVERRRFPFTTTYIRPLGETFADGAVRGLDGIAELLVETLESSW